jgi:hypothetical protein
MISSTQTAAVLHMLLPLIALLLSCGNISGSPLFVCLVGVSTLRVVHAARPEAVYQRSKDNSTHHGGDVRDTTAGANPSPRSPHVNGSPSFMDLLAERVRDMFQQHVHNTAAPAPLDDRKSGRTRTDTADNNKVDTNRNNADAYISSAAAPANGGDDVSAAGVFGASSKSDVVLSNAQQQAERRSINNRAVHERAEMSELGGGAQIDDVEDFEEVTLCYYIGPSACIQVLTRVK